MNVVVLDGLAGLIRADLARRNESREAWIGATLDLCRHLAEARDRMASDTVFGRWCDEQGFGLGHQDRAAAIQMGQDIGEAQRVLQFTERRSLQHIYAQEFRLTHVSKPPKKPPDVRQHQASINMRQQDWAAFKAQAAERGQSAAQRLGELAAEAVSRPVDLDPQSPAQAKLNRALRDARIQIRAEEAEAARLDIRRIFDEHVLPEVNRKHERAERIIANFKGLMTRADFRKLLSCLHPDSADEARKARFAEAFQIVKDLEDVLVKPDPKPANPNYRPLPRTAAELMAMRKTRRP